MAAFDVVLGNDADVLRDRDFQVLLLANAAGPMGVALVSPLLSSLTGPFGVGEVEIGLLFSAFTAPAIVVIPLAGILADRYGRKPPLLAGLLLFGVAGTAIAATDDFRLALALRFLQGVGFAGLTPLLVTSIGDLYEGAAEATAQGVRFTTSGIYQAIVPPIAGALVVVAWQYPFLLYALTIPIAAVVYRRFEEPSSSREEPSGTGRSRLGPLVRLATRRRVLPALLARGVPQLVFYGFLTANSIVVVRLNGGTPGQAGVLVAVNSVVYAVSASQAGRITARFGGRIPPLVASTVALGGGIAVVSMAASFPLAVVGTLAIGAGFGLGLSLYRSLITDMAPDALRGGLVSLGESIGRVTATVTPVAMGIAIAALEPTLGFEAAVRWTGVGVGAVSALAGVLALAVVNATPPVPAETGVSGR